MRHYQCPLIRGLVLAARELPVEPPEEGRFPTSRISHHQQVGIATGPGGVLPEGIPDRPSAPEHIPFHPVFHEGFQDTVLLLQNPQCLRRFDTELGIHGVHKVVVDSVPELPEVHDPVRSRSPPAGVGEDRSLGFPGLPWCYLNHAFGSSDTHLEVCQGRRPVASRLLSVHGIVGRRDGIRDLWVPEVEVPKGGLTQPVQGPMVHLRGCDRRQRSGVAGILEHLDGPIAPLIPP